MMNRAVFLLVLGLWLGLSSCDTNLWLPLDSERQAPERQPLLRIYGSEGTLQALDLDTLAGGGYLLLAQVEEDVESEDEDREDDELRLLLVETDAWGQAAEAGAMRSLGSGDSLLAGIGFLRVGAQARWILAHRRTMQGERPYLLRSVDRRNWTPLPLHRGYQPGEDYRVQAAHCDTVDGRPGVLLVGHTTRLDSPKSSAPGGASDPHDLWLCRVDLDGSLAWERRYGFAEADEALAVYATTQGYLVLGQTQYPASEPGDQDIILVHVNQQGDLIDQRLVDNSLQDQVPVGLVPRGEEGWWLLANREPGTGNARIELYEVGADLGLKALEATARGEATDFLARDDQLYAWTTVNGAAESLALRAYTGGQWSQTWQYGYPGQVDRSARLLPNAYGGFTLLATLGWQNANNMMGLMVLPPDSLSP